jgi:hypothetical protein
MIIFSAMVLMLLPLVVLYVCERAAKMGRGPLADPARMTVLDGQIVPESTPPPTTARENPVSTTAELVFADPRDTERCAAESRLVRELLAGTLDRGRYQTEMAALAAGTASPPVTLPDDPA